MKTLGFIISHKENERRRAIVPADLAAMTNRGYVYIEEGYGDVLGVADSEYAALGAHIVSRSEALACDIVCDPKIGDAEYLDKLNGQTIFGWIHAVQNRDICDKICRAGLTAIAWEDMYEGGRHTFYRNNEIAGEAAVMHAFQCHGVFPYGLKVAIIGRGNTAMGAVKALHYLCADVTIYDRRTECRLAEDLPQYDVIVNAILWDTNRTDHIIYASDLRRMKPGAMIIDISCDRAGGIETSIPTTIEEPDYMVDGIRHYVVDHTPSLFYKTSSQEISHAVAHFFDDLIEGRPNPVLESATCIVDGEIRDPKIIAYRRKAEAAD
ncbi:MAG: N(5)-(carboxyethyl)ornithine synthase [Muribaculaceae bacterium]|nr:N(5)-(carboxyethyl)ornithine synthase [Muribaculaceae bacterium]